MDARGERGGRRGAVRICAKLEFLGGAEYGETRGLPQLPNGSRFGGAVRPQPHIRHVPNQRRGHAKGTLEGGGKV